MLEATRLQVFNHIMAIEAFNHIMAICAILWLKSQPAVGTTPRDRDGSFTHTHGVMHLFPTGVKKVQTGIQMYAAGFVSHLTDGYCMPAKAEASGSWQA